MFVQNEADAIINNENIVLHILQHHTIIAIVCFSLYTFTALTFEQMTKILF